MMIVYSVPLTLIVIVMILVLTKIVKYIASISGKNFKKQQENVGIMNGYIEEIMSGQKVVKVFCHEDETIDKFNELNEKLFNSTYRAHMYANVLMPISNNISHIFYAIIAIVGGLFAINNLMTLGSLVTFLQFTRNFANPIAQIAQQLRACVSLFDNPHYSLYYNSYLQSDFPQYSKIIDPESDDGKTETIITITTQNGTLSKSNCLTKGIPITIKAKDNTPIRGGSVTAKLAGKTLKDANGNISIVKYTENKTIYLPCDLNTFANNTNYDLQVNYSGSSEYKLKESEKTITVKLTT